MHAGPGEDGVENPGHRLAGGTAPPDERGGQPSRQAVKPAGTLTTGQTQGIPEQRGQNQRESGQKLSSYNFV